MALGVLNNLSAIYAENNLSKTSNSLQTVLEQLSSGSKINSGADDAAGLSLVNGLQANSQALVQSATNATEGVGLLDVADGALSQVTNLLDRAVTLATEASNGTLNSSQLAAANQEYTSILSEINNIGTTTTYNQDQVFGGNTVAIYTGDSSTQGSSIDDLYLRTLSESSVGDTGGVMSYNGGQNNVFIDLSKGGTNAAVTDSLSGTSTTITVNYLTNGAGGTATPASANITVGAGTTYHNTVQGMISAIDDSGLGLSASFGTATQAGSVGASAAAAANTAGGGGTDTGIIISGSGVGTGTNGAGEVGTLTVGSALDALGGSLTIVGNDGKSHNILLGTTNSTDTLANLAATINTDGYGVTAATNVAGTVLTFTSSSAAVTVSGTSVTDNGNLTTLTGSPTLDTAYSGTIGTLTDTASIASEALSGTLVIGANTITISSDNTLSTLEAFINKGNYGVTASLDTSGTNPILTLTSPNSALTFNASGLSDGAGTLTPATPQTDNSEYYSMGITGAVTDTTTGNGGTTNTGMVMDTNGVGGTATTSYTDGAGADLASTTLLSATNAQAALGELNSAITDVAAMDGYVGAQINTLNSVGQVLTTQQENVTSAQNALQATDYAAATSAMSKYEILSQTGIAALAQANTVQQEVTKLLQ